MNRLISIVAIIVIFTMAAFPQQSIKIGSAAPAFSGALMDGSPVELSELRGRVVVLTFWSTRCAICHHEIPKLNAMASRFDPSQVVFLALSMENEEKISGYLKNNPFKFQIVPNSFGTVLQYADRDRSGNLDMGFPSFFVIDRSGVVQYRASGYDRTGTLDSAIAKLVAK
jgi:peroxiredoxin